MEKELTIKCLLFTYLKNCLAISYMSDTFLHVPALLSSVSGINENNANHFALLSVVSGFIFPSF